MFESLLNSPKILVMASGKLKSLFEEKGLSAIVLTMDEKVTDGPLPGFKLDMYDKGIVILNDGSYNILHAEMEARPHMLTNAEFAEYQTLKNASNVNGELQTSATDKLTDIDPGHYLNRVVDPAY